MSGDAQTVGQIDWRRLRVLLVDSDARFQSWAQSVLLHTGVNNFHAATSSDKAFEILERNKVDLTLVDLFIDGMAAARFLRELRNPKKSPIPDVSVILLSKSGDQKLLREACEAGIENVVRKPISQNDFLRRISNTVANPRRIIWVDTYVGPDRRHVDDAYYNGPERRGRPKGPSQGAVADVSAEPTIKTSEMGPAIERAEKKKKKPRAERTERKEKPDIKYVRDPADGIKEPQIELVRDEGGGHSDRDLELVREEERKRRERAIELVREEASEKPDPELIVEPLSEKPDAELIEEEPISDAIDWSEVGAHIPGAPPTEEVIGRADAAPEAIEPTAPAEPVEDDDLILPPGQLRDDVEDWSSALDELAGLRQGAEESSDLLPEHDDDEDEFQVESDEAPIETASTPEPDRASVQRGAEDSTRALADDDREQIIERVEELPVDDILEYHTLWLDTRGEEGERAELVGEDLAGYDFTDANLTNANMRDADCTEATFTNANFEAADLRGATFNAARCRGANFNVAKMRRVDLRLSNMKGATLRGTDLSGAQLEGGAFDNADMTGANVFHTDVSRTDLSNTIGLQQAQLGSVSGNTKTKLPPGLRLSRG